MERLHEITLPGPVSYFPQTVGWGIVAIFLLSLGIWIGWRVARYRIANRYRGVALDQLAVLVRELRTPARGQALAAIPQLVKRVTLEAYPRVDVASLSGGEIGDEQTNSLTSLVKQWIRTHKVKVTS